MLLHAVVESAVLMTKTAVLPLPRGLVQTSTAELLPRPQRIWLPGCPAQTVTGRTAGSATKTAGDAMRWGGGGVASENTRPAQGTVVSGTGDGHDEQDLPGREG